MSATESFLPQVRVRRRERTRAGRSAVIKAAAAVLATAVLVGAALGVHGLLSHRGHAPISLDRYMSGEGVAFAPAGAHYSVRLPQQPVVKRSVVHAAGYDVVTRAASVSTREYEVAFQEISFAFSGVSAARARDTRLLLSRPTMQRSIDGLLRSANVVGARTVATKVTGFPAIVYRNRTSPLNGSVAAASVYTHGSVFTMLVHSDTDADAVLVTLERSLHFSAR